MEVRSITAVVTALNEAEVQYLIVGGLAVNAHGYERLTRDLDLVIGLDPANLIRGLSALYNIGYSPAIPVSAQDFASPEIRELWRREKNMLVLKLWGDLHRRTPVDVFVYEPFDFQAEYAAAARFKVSTGVSAPFVTLDTLLSMKREAARPQDLSDIAALEAARKLRQTGGND